MIILVTIEKEKFGNKYCSEVARLLREISEDIDNEGSGVKSNYLDSQGNEGCIIKFIK